MREMWTCFDLSEKETILPPNPKRAPTGLRNHFGAWERAATWAGGGAREDADDATEGDAENAS